jgi:hypothetical protein
MDRFSLGPISVVVVLVLWFATPVSGQQFSFDPRYLAFYESHLVNKSSANIEFKVNSESTIALWWIIEEFGDLEVSREQLRDWLSRHAELWPQSEDAESVASHLKTVKAMLEEKRPADTAIVEQLIFDLRDSNERPYVIPSNGVYIIRKGTVRIDGVRGKLNSQLDVTQQLCEIGYDAIPARFLRLLTILTTIL